MPLVLPTRPAPRRVNLTPISARNALKPAFGGDSLRLNRKGTMYSAEVEWPPMTYEQGLAFGDLETEDDTVVVPIIQPGISTGAPGSPVVDGGNQAGSTLNLRNVTPQYLFGKGWYLSHIDSAGRRRTYRCRETCIANADGDLAIPLRTLIRLPPADGDVVELARPMIEGYAEVEGLNDVGTDRLVMLKATITERG